MPGSKAYLESRLRAFRQVDELLSVGRSILEKDAIAIRLLEKEVRNYASAPQSLQLLAIRSFLTRIICETVDRQRETALTSKMSSYLDFLQLSAVARAVRTNWFAFSLTNFQMGTTPDPGQLRRQLKHALLAHHALVSVQLETVESAGDANPTMYFRVAMVQEVDEALGEKRRKRDEEGSNDALLQECQPIFFAFHPDEPHFFASVRQPDQTLCQILAECLGADSFQPLNLSGERIDMLRQMRKAGVNSKSYAMKNFGKVGIFKGRSDPENKENSLKEMLPVLSSFAVTNTSANVASQEGVCGLKLSLCGTDVLNGAIALRDSNKCVSTPIQDSFNWWQQLEQLTENDIDLYKFA